MKKIVLATRGSKLALVQANMVKELLEDKGALVELKKIKTGGDKDQKSPLSKIGGKGLFIKEIEMALVKGEADIAVHSGKDLPYLLCEGMTIASNPMPADPRDCLVTNRGCILQDDAVIGTGSQRRISEFKRLMPNARFKEIRGNIDTRLGKLKDGQYDGIFLAKAGMDRLKMDLSDFDVRVFEANEVIPAASQGILAVECRQADTELVALLKSISDPIAEKRFHIEREIFCSLQADCSVAVGVHASFDLENQIEVKAMFQGRRCSESCKSEDYELMLERIKEKIWINSEM